MLHVSWPLTCSSSISKVAHCFLRCSVNVLEAAQVAPHPRHQLMQLHSAASSPSRIAPTCISSSSVSRWQQPCSCKPPDLCKATGHRSIRSWLMPVVACSSSGRPPPTSWQLPDRRDDFRSASRSQGTPNRAVSIPLAVPIKKRAATVKTGNGIIRQRIGEGGRAALGSRQALDDHKMGKQ